MVILEVTVPPLGRFLVHDDLTLEEVLLLPSTTDEEMKVIHESMLRKDAPWITKKDVLLASLASVFSIQKKDVTFHLDNEPEVEWEPDQE